MIRELGLLAIGWVPLWLLVLLARPRLKAGRILMGAGLAGFVGGMCSVELRRHGLQSLAPGAVPLPLVGLCADEVLHYALLGAAGALLLETALDRMRADGAP